MIPDEDWRLAGDRDPSAVERVLRASFWTLVYHLEPQRWDRLSQVEPIAPGLVAVLPRVQRALDVGAGSGRLTYHLTRRAALVAAIEPSLGLLRMLRYRLPRVQAVAGWAESLPVRDGWSQLTAACGLRAGSKRPGRARAGHLRGRGHRADQSGGAGVVPVPGLGSP